MPFADTNILLYAVSTDTAEARKRETARKLLDQDDIVLSTQVLQEFYVQATRETRATRLSHEQAASLIEAWLRFQVVETTVVLVQNALATCTRWQLSYWDAAIVEAARAGSCSLLLSEDLQDGMNFAGVRVRNPF